MPLDVQTCVKRRRIRLITGVRNSVNLKRNFSPHTQRTRSSSPRNSTAKNCTTPVNGSASKCGPGDPSHCLTTDFSDPAARAPLAPLTCESVRTVTDHLAVLILAADAVVPARVGVARGDARAVAVGPCDRQRPRGPVRQPRPPGATAAPPRPRPVNRVYLQTARGRSQSPPPVQAGSGQVRSGQG